MTNDNDENDSKQFGSHSENIRITPELFPQPIPTDRALSDHTSMASRITGLQDPRMSVNAHSNKNVEYKMNEHETQVVFGSVIANGRKRLANGKTKYMDVNYHDIAICLNPSNKIVDNLLILIDGPLSSLLHLLILCKLTFEHDETQHRINEILKCLIKKNKKFKKIILDTTKFMKSLIKTKENNENDEIDAGKTGTNQNDENDNNSNTLGSNSKKFKTKKAKKLAKAKKKQQALIKKFQLKQTKFKDAQANKSKLQASMRSASVNSQASGNNNNNLDHTTSIGNHSTATTAGAGDKKDSDLLTEFDDDEEDEKEHCVICCQAELPHKPLGKIIFLQHNLFPKFSRIPDGVADGHIQVLYQYVFSNNSGIDRNHLNNILSEKGKIRIEDFAYTNEVEILEIFTNEFGNTDSIKKYAKLLHQRAKDLAHAQDRFLGLSHRIPSPVEQLIGLCHRLDSVSDEKEDDYYQTLVKNDGNLNTNSHSNSNSNSSANRKVDSQSVSETNTSDALNNNDINMQDLAIELKMQAEVEQQDAKKSKHSSSKSRHKSKQKRKEGNKPRVTNRDYYHTSYSLDIDIDRHRTINFEGDGGIQMLSCGHCLHLDCFASFLSHQISVADSHPTAYNAIDYKKEFTCPLCRRLGNALLPMSLDLPFLASDFCNYQKEDAVNRLSWVKQKRDNLEAAQRRSDKRNHERNENLIKRQRHFQRQKQQQQQQQQMSAANIHYANFNNTADDTLASVLSPRRVLMPVKPRTELKLQSKK